jgi:hypothetical protein
MSVLDRALTAIKDVILLREQMTQMRSDFATLSGNVASLVGDIRSIEQRLARLEGANDTMRVISGSQARLPSTREDDQ